MSADTVETAISRADAAYRRLRREAPPSDRAAILRTVANLYRERKDELAATILREMGKPIAQAVGEVTFSASIYDYYADNAEALLADQSIEPLSGTGRAFIRRAPVGVLLGIMPWNYPYYQVARFAAPNLLLGNTILLKHSRQCPQSSAAMEAIFTEAGLPADAYINLYVDSSQIESIIADPRVQGVSLTGSEAAGSAVAEQAGRHLTKVVLELGGSDPFIVLSTDDLDGVVAKAVGTRIANTGQACNAAKRFIIVESLYEDFLAKFVAALSGIEGGDPQQESTRMGPLSSRKAAEDLEAQVQRAAAQGATVALGGTRRDSYFAPTVLTDVAEGTQAYSEEFFGPVAQVYRVTSEAEAVALANDIPFGLGSYLFTTDADQALRVADQIEAGMVFVNGTDGEGPEMPFGGVKRSGFGRELGALGIDEFANKKLIRIEA